MATLLVVEDDATVLSLLRDFLGQEGHTVLAARDGSEALTIARRELPDLILSDIMMPVMGGIEMIRMLRSEFPTREIAVILMSAVQPPDRSRGRGSGRLHRQTVPLRCAGPPDR